MDLTRLQSSGSHKDHTMGERNKPHSYRHEPSVPRETTPPSSWRRWRCHWGRWRPPRQRSAGVSPLQSAASDLRFGVSLFATASLWKTSGDYFIGVFRSRGCFWAKDRRKRGHEGRNRWAHAAPVPGRVGPPILGLRPPFVCFFRSVFLLPK